MPAGRATAAAKAANPPGRPTNQSNESGENRKVVGQKIFALVHRSRLTPAADPIIFCDGTGGGLSRFSNALEFSHWRPNKTPGQHGASRRVGKQSLGDALGAW